MNDNQNSYYQNKKSINQNYWKLSTKTELETHFELFFSQRFNFPSALVPILIENKVSKDNFELFLDPKIKNFLPDPSIFIDMDKTVKRIANEIETKIKNSNVLDLYSGVGSFGLECLSRDAKEVTFIEKNNQISKILKNNLDNLSLMNKSEVINGSIENSFGDAGSCGNACCAVSFHINSSNISKLREYA